MIQPIHPHYIQQPTSALILKVDEMWSYVAKKPNCAGCDGLYYEILAVDSAAFAALNDHNVSRFMTFFTKDVEFYNDGGGLTTYDQTSTNFGTMFKGAPDIRRELVKGSLAVYPLNGYGAIAIGAHRFCHTENAREECGTFKFTTIWQKKGSEWQMSRVVSYGH